MSNPSLHWSKVNAGAKHRPVSNQFTHSLINLSILFIFMPNFSSPSVRPNNWCSKGIKFLHFFLSPSWQTNDSYIFSSKATPLSSKSRGMQITQATSKYNRSIVCQQHHQSSKIFSELSSVFPYLFLFFFYFSPFFWGGCWAAFGGAQFWRQERKSKLPDSAHRTQD